jgi:hypothetical protein
MAHPLRRDDLGTALVIAGVALAAVATTLPVVEATGRNGVFSATTLSMLPVFTWAKLVALGLLTASLFVGALARFRLLFGAVAAVMIFVPAVSAFLSAIYAWGEVRQQIVQATGARNPFVNPAEAAAAICAAGLLVIGGLWRIERRAAATPATGDQQGAVAA